MVAASHFSAVSTRLALDAEHTKYNSEDLSVLLSEAAAQEIEKPVEVTSAGGVIVAATGACASEAVADLQFDELPFDDEDFLQEFVFVSAAILLEQAETNIAKKLRIIIGRKLPTFHFD